MRPAVSIFDVTEDVVTRFAGATGDPNPRFGGSASLAPPLVAVVAGWDAMTAAIAPLLTARVLPVHVAQEATFRRPVRVGDRLRSVAVVASMSRALGGAMAVVEMGVDDADDSRVCDSTATVFLPGVEASPFGGIPSGASTASSEVKAPAAEAVAVEYAIDHDQARRYAEASGDHNPIHLDDEAARASGFSGTIVHGMCILALACRAATDALCGGDPTQVRRLAARFAKPVQPGDILRILFGPSGAVENGHRQHRFRGETGRGLALKRGAIELGA